MGAEWTEVEPSHLTDQRIKVISNGLEDLRGVASISSRKNACNPVTTAIVLAFFEIQRWFPTHDLLHWLPKIIASCLQQMVDVIPRHAAIPKEREIKNARLGFIAKSYIPLTRLSLDILKNKGVSDTSCGDESPTLLIDVAELWELYVLDALQEAAPPQVDVLHGTYEANEYLLSDENGEHKLGKLLPDYLVTCQERPLIIGDAPWMSPKRDDLYQITAYLSRYSECCSGSLYYPERGGVARDISDKNPWPSASGQTVNFIVIPTERSEAISVLRQHHAGDWGTSGGTIGGWRYLDIVRGIRSRFVY